MLEQHPLIMTKRPSLPTRRRYAVYISGLGLWLSGVAWLILHDVISPDTTTPFTPATITPLCLSIHGACAMAALWVGGLLWGTHIAPRWRGRHNRVSGAIITGAFLLLAITGYCLYYMGDETVRAWASILHWGIGLLLLPAFLIHRHKQRAS
ncbi:putative membrane spanning protein [Granulibacter bethesdensis CGDNIH4]|nr:putative membrane spanning protein [Granulibacter bethesdensis CGDNIH4]